jgi:hypothetical protein
MPSPKEVMIRIFIIIKNPSSSTGFEPANLRSNGKHATHLIAEGDISLGSQCVMCHSCRLQTMVSVHAAKWSRVFCFAPLLIHNLTSEYIMGLPLAHSAVQI